MVSLVFFDILQLPHTVISNSEKLTHPIVKYTVTRKKGSLLKLCFFGKLLVLKTKTVL